MIFIIPLIFGAIGAAVGAVAGALTTHAIGESDRQEAKHHRTVANELTNKYSALEKRYYELADESKKQIFDLTRQRALDEVEKGGLRLALRLQHDLIELMYAIDREPTEAALKEFVAAVELTNTVLRQLQEKLIPIPSDYYARVLIAAEVRRLKGDRQNQELLEITNLNSEALPVKKVYKQMSAQEFQATYTQTQELGKRLLQYLQEINKSSLQGVEEDLKKALSALEKQKYQVAVIAAMKAGKSTFLNALIGADVLASETESCTVCRTEVRPIDSSQNPKLLEYREGKRKPVVLAEGEPEAIQQVFLERTRQIRATQNQNNTEYFVLEHPIEAISKLSALSGFRLIDTPGPNEWESANFNTVALKQTTLEVLRTCDAILFVLDYTSFKDNTNEELLKVISESGRESLLKSSSKMYFILNKIDRKSERDRPIEEVIQELNKALVGFGVQEPKIYPVSSLQGLLAKLIQEKKANGQHKSDFKKFFLGRYIQEDEDGELVVPKMKDIAPQALLDSGIKTIEDSVLQTIVKNSGWNLLDDVLTNFNKVAQSIEEAIATEIKGWQIAFEELEQKVQDYTTRSEKSQKQVEQVKKSIENDKEKLLSNLIKEIDRFTERAKVEIKTEIDNVAKSQRNQPRATKKKQGLLGKIMEETLKKQNLLGKIMEETFKKQNLLEKLVEKVFENFTDFFNNRLEDDPYKIRLSSSEQTQKISQVINQYCTPLIQEFWLNTQDQLVREGTEIRETLVREIQRDIQTVSDEISNYLGDSLEVNIQPSPILFPKFEFAGIDAKVQHHQQVVSRVRKETRTKSRCCKSDKVYEVDVPYKETISYYEIDLMETYQAICQKIDEQVSRNYNF
ncbi:MAG: dynamin family protein [Desertifilum sp.]|nr:dynamin family protein [Desertifilum sp.]